MDSSSSQESITISCGHPAPSRGSSCMAARQQPRQRQWRQLSKAAHERPDQKWPADAAKVLKPVSTTSMQRRHKGGSSQ
jgi:hypothetical protein